MLNEILSVFCLVKIYYLLNNKLQSTEWQLPFMHPHLLQGGLLQVPLTKPSQCHPLRHCASLYLQQAHLDSWSWISCTNHHLYLMYCCVQRLIQNKSIIDKTKEKRIFLPILKKQIEKSLPGEALEPTQLCKKRGMFGTDGLMWLH